MPFIIESVRVDVRLRGGLNQSHGNVEIGLEGDWGTVCDDNWDINDAHVVCRMLGYASAIAATLRSSFGRGSGRIWLNNVTCTGEEESIDKCSHSGWGVANSYHCYHGREAGVICGGKFKSHYTCYSNVKCMPQIMWILSILRLIVSNCIDTHHCLPSQLKV